MSETKTTITDTLRAAFDGDDVARKNIALRHAHDEIKRLRNVMGEAHGLLDEHMGDTDPQDPDHPLLRAAQLLAEAVP